MDTKKFTKSSLEELREQQAALFDPDKRGYKHETSPEAQKRLSDYWECVFAKKVQHRPKYAVVRQVKLEMDYQDARKKFWSILQFRAVELSRISGKHFKWEFTNEQAELIKHLIMYFINHPGGKFDLSKGLFVYGAYGCGKTEIMQALSRFTKENELTKAFEFTSMSHVYQDAKADKNSDPITPNVQHDRCFDEFGRYTGPVKRYGDELDINEALIEERYERNRKYGQLTHFISNSQPKDSEKIVSEMIFDRVRGMVQSVRFPGNSKR